MKSSSGVTARTRSARCHERDPAPRQETTNLPPSLIHLKSQITTSPCRSPAFARRDPSSWSTGRSTASCICTIQLIGLTSPIESPALNCLERPQAGTSRVLGRRIELAAVRGVLLPKSGVSAPRKRIAKPASKYVRFQIHCRIWYALAAF